MAFLVPDEIRTEYGIEIKKKILPAGKKPGAKLSNGTGKPRYVTIHNTDDINEAAGTNDAEQYARATFNGNMGGVTVHYYIDETDCWQILEEDEIGYHAADGKSGPGNGSSIAIEIIMDGSGSNADKEAENRGARLAAILLHRYSLGIEGLANHNIWYPKKYCPAYILPRWDEFRRKVEANLLEIIAGENKEEEEADDMAETDGVIYRVQVGSFRNREFAENYVKTLKASGFDAFVVVAENTAAEKN